MALKSSLLSGEPKLESAAISNAGHIMKGASGVHVGKVQLALALIDDLVIDKAERTSRLFGASTERAVLAFKSKRSIINRSYQSAVDPIVGIMTMAALDAEMLKVEAAINEATLLCSLAGVLGYDPNEPHFITNSRPAYDVAKTHQAKAK